LNLASSTARHQEFLDAALFRLTAGGVRRPSLPTVQLSEPFTPIDPKALHCVVSTPTN
jgi:hypothetical protein